jgi:hypothetical protein
MKLIDLINITRLEMDDADPNHPLITDAEHIEFANDAELEACRRGRLILDSTTTAICQIAVVANTASYSLDPRVQSIRRAKLTGLLPLKRRNLQDMDSQYPGWDDAATGMPIVFIPDDTGQIRLWPTPSANTTLSMIVVRSPLAEMNDETDSPEIAPRFHRSLRYWMMYRAYSKQDSQANDPKKALESLAMFEQEFGQKSSAINETWIAREQMEFDGTF